MWLITRSYSCGLGCHDRRTLYVAASVDESSSSPLCSTETPAPVSHPQTRLSRASQRPDAQRQPPPHAQTRLSRSRQVCVHQPPQSVLFSSTLFIWSNLTSFQSLPYFRNVLGLTDWSQSHSLRRTALKQTTTAPGCIC